MQNQYMPEGTLINTAENREYLSGIAGLERAHEKQKILEGKVLLCDNDFSLHIDLGKIRGIMPKSEVEWKSDGECIKDIAVLTRVGKAICFKIIGFRKNENGETYAILSRRLAQAECMQNYISALSCGDILPAKVTHLENFGAFVDIGCGIISLLPIDSISVSRISHPRDRFSVDERIYVVIKSIDRNKRIYVSHRELLGTWEENAALFSIGQTVSGIVRSVENYGIFIELTPNLAGLAELKDNISVNQCAAVYIKNIIPEKMKIKLVIIDSQNSVIAEPKPVIYFTDMKKTSHIDSWIYSPESSQKVIESTFDIGTHNATFTKQY
ncbi:MAG: S1 RNA-binding domain-containing protein [Eubacteriales bacterium]|nr:S1 RNA-binding domain-containing protein [Eubacteriales bacterium]